MTTVTAIMVVLMLSSAVSMLLLRNYVAVLAASSVMSMSLAMLFVTLRAPDVAMTEATVGAGLASLVFALALRRLGLWRIDAAESDGDGESES